LANQRINEPRKIAGTNGGAADPQKYGDLVRDGVCGLFIAEKLGVSPATATV